MLSNSGSSSSRSSSSAGGGRIRRRRGCGVDGVIKRLLLVYVPSKPGMQVSNP
jgi:hypothetical protein